MSDHALHAVFPMVELRPEAFTRSRRPIKVQSVSCSWDCAGFGERLQNVVPFLFRRCHGSKSPRVRLSRAVRRSVIRSPITGTICNLVRACSSQHKRDGTEFSGAASGGGALPCSRKLFVSAYGARYEVLLPPCGVLRLHVSRLALRLFAGAAKSVDSANFPHSVRELHFLLLLWVVGGSVVN